MKVEGGEWMVESGGRQGVESHNTEYTEVRDVRSEGVQMEQTQFHKLPA